LVAFIVISFDVMSLGLLIFHFMHNIAALDLPCPLLSSNIFPVHLRKHFQGTSMRSHLFFQIVSPFFQFGVFAGLRYHDFFKTISRFFQMEFHDYFKRIF